MIASSAFVLAALTMTGIYMKRDVEENTDEGYVVDFTALENNVNDKLGEIADNSVGIKEDMTAKNVTTDDLDYQPMPLEGEIPISEQVGSADVEIPGVTDGLAKAGDEQEDSGEDGSPKPNDAEAVEEERAASGNNMVVAQELHFSKEEGLTRPVNGEILLPYSMDAGIYFATLAQYKYNPAVVYSAQTGTLVAACAQARVADIYDDAKLGCVVVLDLGDGYQAVYGQMDNLKVAAGDYVEAGEILGEVGNPTKYYIVEGSNLYFGLTRDGEAVNPEVLMSE